MTCKWPIAINRRWTKGANGDPSPKTDIPMDFHAYYQTWGFTIADDENNTIYISDPYDGGSYPAGYIYKMTGSTNITSEQIRFPDGYSEVPFAILSDIVWDHGKLCAVYQIGNTDHTAHYYEYDSFTKNGNENYVHLTHQVLWQTFRSINLDRDRNYIVAVVTAYRYGYKDFIVRWNYTTGASEGNAGRISPAGNGANSKSFIDTDNHLLYVYNGNDSKVRTYDYLETNGFNYISPKSTEATLAYPAGASLGICLDKFGDMWGMRWGRYEGDYKQRAWRFDGISGDRKDRYIT